MLKPVREYFVKDGVVMETWQYDSSWMGKRKAVYEVIRIINGNPFFSAEHIDRLMQSSGSVDTRGNTDPEKIKDCITKLIHANSEAEGNILCCIVQNKENLHILAWYVEHHYPSWEEYEKGVNLRLLKAIRKNPGTKVWNAELRSKAEYIIRSSEVYEVLLVDKKKNITEGSRSNIFFIRGNAVFTPPENKVLKGITRQKVMEICEEKLISVTEKEIPLHEIPFYEAAFITGTSPGILPVSMIEKHRFNTSNDLMRRLMMAYQDILATATESA